MAAYHACALTSSRGARGLTCSPLRPSKVETPQGQPRPLYPCPHWTPLQKALGPPRVGL